MCTPNIRELGNLITWMVLQQPVMHSTDDLYMSCNHVSLSKQEYVPSLLVGFPPKIWRNFFFLAFPDFFPDLDINFSDIFQHFVRSFEMVITTFYRWKSRHFLIWGSPAFQKIPDFSEKFKKIFSDHFFPRFSLTFQVGGNPVYCSNELELWYLIWK